MRPETLRAVRLLGVQVGDLWAAVASGCGHMGVEQGPSGFLAFAVVRSMALSCVTFDRTPNLSVLRVLIRIRGVIVSA